MDKELEKRLDLMNTEIDSLTISLDVFREMTEALDQIGVVIYKLYNKIRDIIDD